MESSNYLPYDIDKSFRRIWFSNCKKEWKRIAHKKARQRVRAFLETGREPRGQYKWFVTGWDLD